VIAVHLQTQQGWLVGICAPCTSTVEQSTQKTARWRLHLQCFAPTTSAAPNSALMQTGQEHSTCGCITGSINLWSDSPDAVCCSAMNVRESRRTCHVAHVCIYTYTMHIHIHVQIHTHTHIHKHTYSCTCTYTYTFTRTHTHSSSPWCPWRRQNLAGGTLLLFFRIVIQNRTQIKRSGREVE